MATLGKNINAKIEALGPLNKAFPISLLYKENYVLDD